MLWTIAVVQIILWMLGLGTGFTMGSFIHVLYAAAVALLVVSFSQEVMKPCRSGFPKWKSMKEIPGKN
jgi:hypothetical protein